MCSVTLDSACLGLDCIKIDNKMISNARWWGRLRGLIAAVLLFGTASTLPGQSPRSPAPSSAPVERYSNLICAVGKLEASVAFYRDLVGLEMLSLNHGSPGDKIAGPYIANVCGRLPKLSSRRPF